MSISINYYRVLAVSKKIFMNIDFLFIGIDRDC